MLLKKITVLGCNQKCFIYIVKIASCLTHRMIINIVIFSLITDSLAIPIYITFYYYHNINICYLFDMRTSWGEGVGT